MDLAILGYAILVMGVIGALFGFMLDVADKRFAVQSDEKVTLVRGCLSGANCGACGFTGCDAFARAVVEEKVLPNGCPVGGAKAAKAISEIMQVQAEMKEPSVARVICQGTTDTAKDRYTYGGYQRCSLAASLGGGPKQCVYACIGLGDCARACQFGAIEMKDGIAYIDENKCTHCGLCVKACPRNVICLQPQGAKVLVRCHNTDTARAAREVCKKACIACKLCEKACEYDAIHVVDNCAMIDDQKCTACKACVKACPNQCITIQ